MLDLIEAFHRLKTLVLSESAVNYPQSLVKILPASIRRVHLLQHVLYIDEDRPDNPRDLLHLESFTFTWLVPAAQCPAPAQEDSDLLVDLQRVVDANIVAPQCTFKYRRSTKSPESALADAVAAFNL